MPAVRRTTSSRMNRLHQGRGFTSTGTLGRLVLEGKIHCEVRPGRGRAVEADRAAQGLDAVGEAGAVNPDNLRQHEAAVGSSATLLIAASRSA
jgi:hypothetical protein